MKKISWFVFCAIIAVSCLDEPDCFQLNNNVFVLNFKILGGGTDAYPVNGVQTPRADLVFLPETVLSSNVALPLDPLNDNMEYVFMGRDGRASTLSLAYKVQVQFVSADCGERYVFTELDVPSSDFDSIRIINSIPTNPVRPNIDIYRCPRTDLLGVSFTSEVIMDTVSAEGFGVIYAVNDTIQSIVLPLNPAANETSFRFDYSDGTQHTLTVTYRITTRSLFAICGDQTIIDSLAYDPARSDFATVTLKEDSIHDLPISNFEITP